MQQLSQTNRFKQLQKMVSDHYEDRCTECGAELTPPVFRNSIPGDYVQEQECTECGAFYSY